MEFKERLREELDYQDLTVKELAAKAGLVKGSIDNYLGKRKSIPPADVVVKIAQVLNITVEYLVTGKNSENPDVSKYMPIRDTIDELLILPPEVLTPIKAMIHAAAQSELEKKEKTVSTG